MPYSHRCAVIAICAFILPLLAGCYSAPPPLQAGAPHETSEQLIAIIKEPMPLLDPTPYYAASSLIVSPDGRHFAYAADLEGGWSVVRDGVEGAKFTHIFRDSFAFSPDSKRLGYVVDLTNRSTVIIDGRPNKVYE